MLPVALGLSASLCWGLADFVAGLETRRLPGVLVVCVSQAVGLVGVACLAVVTTELTPTAGLMPAAVVAGVTSAIGITALYRALSIGTMSIVAPITATGVAVPVIVGLIEGEGPREAQAFGIVAAAIGVLLVTRGNGSVQARALAPRKSIALALLAALFSG